MNTATKLFTIALLGVTLDVSGAPVGALQANAEFDQSKEKLTAAEQKITELVAKREMYKKEKVSASDKEELLASINKSPTANSAELVQGEWNINWKHYATYYKKRASACEAVPKIKCSYGTKQGPLTRDTSVNNVNAKKGQCVPLPKDDGLNNGEEDNGMNGPGAKGGGDEGEVGMDEGADEEELLASINKSPTANSAELVQGEWNINWKHYATYYKKRASACEAVPKITCGKGTKQGPLTRDTSVNNVNAKKGQCVPLPEDALAKRRPLYAIGMLPAAH